MGHLCILLRSNGELCEVHILWTSGAGPVFRENVGSDRKYRKVPVTNKFGTIDSTELTYWMRWWGISAQTKHTPA